MNWLALTAGVLTLAAFGIHAGVGAREFRSFAPDTDDGAARTAWLQALCGWHWVSASLLGAGSLFLIVASTDWVRDERSVLIGLAVYFLACGVAWLGTLMISGRGVDRRFMVLGQWGFCMLVAGPAAAAAYVPAANP
ncbi:MAG: hypothetical protein AAGK21_01270 [Bacteroidota bacterium]